MARQEEVLRLNQAELVVRNESYLYSEEYRTEEHVMSSETAQGLRSIERAKRVEPVLAAVIPVMVVVLTLAAAGMFLAWKTSWNPWVCLGWLAMCALCVAPMSVRLAAVIAKALSSGS